MLEPHVVAGLGLKLVLCLVSGLVIFWLELGYQDVPIYGSTTLL